MIDSVSNSPRISDSKVSVYIGHWMVPFIIVLLLCSHYLPSPWAVFVADDWSNMARSTQYTSGMNALTSGLQDPNRPLSTAAVEFCFRLFGYNAFYWTIVSLLGNTLLVVLLMRLVLELTGRNAVSFVSGVCFVLLPNLTETYHWSTQVLNEVSCALVFYALSGWLWVAYARFGGIWRLGLSVLAYGLGLFSYEAGVLLPAAYLILLPWRREGLRSIFRWIPFAVVVVLYGAWRITDAFGSNVTWSYPPHMEAGGLSLWGISWQGRQIVQWWIGDHMFGALLAGLQSFSTLSPWTRRLLVPVNIVLVWLIGFVLRRLAVAHEKEGVSTLPFHPLQVALFSAVWTFAAFAICLISYSAARLNVIPAMGISVLLAMLLTRLPIRTWSALLFVPAVLAMMSNQGTAENYRQAGALNQRLFSYLGDTQDDWSGKQVLLFDTHSMRQRLTSGLLTPVGEDPATWAEYGNAPLFRGFVPGGMIRILGGKARVVHDVEHGAHIEGDTLVWHERYDPTQPRATPMSDVYVIDVQQVAGE